MEGKKDKFMKCNDHIKGIFLDIGWTMCRPKSGHWWLNETFYRLADEEGMEMIDKEQMEQVLDEAYHLLLENHRMDDEEQELQQFFAYYTLISERLPALELNRDKLYEISHDQVYNDANYIFFDDVEETLQRLKQRYKLGVISDTWPSLRRVLQNAGLSDYFDGITFSCDLGVFKPDEALYQDALRKLGLSGPETVFVDDNPICLEGAEKSGILPILINRPGKASMQSRFASIEALRELE